MPNQSHWVTITLFIVALCYLAIGVFPFAPMESDGNHIANGVTQMVFGNSPKNPFSYRYEAQSGTYWMIYWVSKIGKLQPFDAFCLLSLVGALIFLLTASFSIARYAKEHFALVGLLLIAFQEVWTSAYYANSNILAAAFLFTGLLLGIYSQKVFPLMVAGLLFGLGVWMRFDVLLMFPVIPLLIHRESWQRTVLNTLILGCVAGVTILSALQWSDVSLQEILASSQRHFQLHAATTRGLGIPWLGNSNIKSHLAYFSFLVVVLLGLGFWHLVSSHHWRDLALFLMGVLPLYLTYLGDLTTPKYLLYAAPFFAFLSLKGWRSFEKFPSKNRLLGFVLLSLLFLGQYGFGVRLRFVSKPYYYGAHPTFIQLLKISIPLRNIDELSVVLGPGARISTVDRDRLFSGIFFAPLMWRSQKIQLNADLSQLAEQIEDSQRYPVHLLVDEDDPLQQVLIFLFRLGFRCEARSLRERYVYPCQQDQGKSVILMDIPGNFQRKASVFAENLAEVNVDHFFFVVTAPWQEYFIDQHFQSHPGWKVEKLSSLVYEFSSK